MQEKHAKAGCLQFAVIGPAGKPEMDGISSMQMLQVFSASSTSMTSLPGLMVG